VEDSTSRNRALRETKPEVQEIDDDEEEGLNRKEEMA
jgi:hypothetical protein